MAKGIQHHDSTLLKVSCWTRLAIMLHHVASCCIMLHHVVRVERGLIFIEHLIQHRTTFLLFSCMNNKVALVWPRTLTLLHSRTRSKSSHRQGQRDVWPKIRDHYSSQIFNLHNPNLLRTTCCIRMATQSNTIQQSWIQQCWTMLHSFDRSFSCTQSC